MPDTNMHPFRRWVRAIEPYLVVVLPVVGTVMLALGQSFEGIGDWLRVIGGAILILTSGWTQLNIERRRRRTASADLDEATRFRVAMKDALQPVAEAMADMPYLPKRLRKSALAKVVERSVAALNLRSGHWQVTGT